MRKIHLDTDLGGDLDDLCALALLLCSEDVQLTGITVVGDTQGRRTGYTRYVLALAGRGDIPVAAGADTSQGYYRTFLGLPPEERYWPEPVPPAPNPPEQAVELLRQSLEQGAAVVGIGPYTNLHLLETRYPGILRQASLYLMGGYVYPPRAGFPAWDYQADFNVQVDVRSAKHVLESARPTLIPLSVTVETALRRAHLQALRQSGALGQLIARQALAFAEDEQMERKFGQTCAGVPADMINFQHDPLAAAVALGWEEGIEFEELPVVVEENAGWLSQRIHPAGRHFRVVTRVDGPKFNQFWLDTVTKQKG